MTRTMWTRWTAVVALSLTPTMALAADPDYDKEAGKALFDVAMSRMRQGKLSEACQKLEESVALYAGTGILFQLGTCYEKLGRTASAWKQFKLVAERSRADAEAARDAEARRKASAREAEAERRAAALEPNLAQVIISVPEQARALGLELRLDDHVLSPDEWNVPLVQDEGKHGLQARAPGRQTWQHLIVVEPAPNVVTVVVPALSADFDYEALEPTPPPEETLPPKDDEEPTTSNLLGASLVGGGVLLTGAGAVLTLLAADHYNDAVDKSQGGLVGTAESTQEAGDDLRLAGVSLVVLGLVAAAAGGVLVVSDATAEPPRTGWIAPTVGPKGGGLSAGGTF